MICVLRGEFYKVFTGNSFYGRAAIENSKGPIPKKLVPSPIPYSTLSSPLILS